MKKHGPVVLVLASLLAAPHIAMAETKHKLRAGFSLFDGSGTSMDEFTNPPGPFLDTESGSTSIGGEASLGFRLGYEYRATPRLGVSFDMESVSNEIEFIETREIESFDFFTQQSLGMDSGSAIAEGDVRATPVTVGLHIYLKSGERSEVYIGPVLGYVFYGGLRQEAWTLTLEPTPGSFSVRGEPAETTPLEDDTSLGLLLGFDLRTRDGDSGFQGSLGYLPSTVQPKDPDSPIKLDLDFLVLRFGVAYRF